MRYQGVRAMMIPYLQCVDNGITALASRYIDGIMQKSCNSIANLLELRLFWINQTIDMWAHLGAALTQRTHDVKITSLLRRYYIIACPLGI